ncbi:sperm flagellar protein 1 [Caloenas nicobarica]|uniref:sperm flagellar protein 1 n=1 Tax=Caloenas nicobarica TaxID=187106 RepID=UPI0032B83CAD
MATSNISSLVEPGAAATTTLGSTTGWGPSSLHPPGAGTPVLGFSSLATAARSRHAPRRRCHGAGTRPGTRGRMAGGGAAGELRALYGWLDAVPLSRPRRNIARDFSDGVLAAEVVKFFFPAMVQLHSYVPASSTPQKLANWGHLNRKVLSKLNFSIPADMIREVVQCRPGTVEQVLLLLRQKIEEKQKQSKAVPGPGQVSEHPTCLVLLVGAMCYGREGDEKHHLALLAEPGGWAAQEELSYLETGYSKAKSGAGGGSAQDAPRAAGVTKSRHGCPQAAPGDTAVRLQLAEREQALLLARETIQILQLKVGRLEQLLHLKNVRIDDLSRRLRDAQCHQR